MKIKKIIIVISILLFVGNNSSSQVYYTKNGSISFFSKATMEDIKADNNQVISIINFQSGEIRLSVLNTAFHFPKAMMEEHFNSDYIQSDQFPSSTFKGMIADISKTDITKDGTYNITVQGDLNIHGITRNITSPATLMVKEGKLSGNAKFKILLKDYNIKIPSIVANNIAESIDITVSCNYEKK
jgi:YceI-like domain